MAESISAVFVMSIVFLVRMIVARAPVPDTIESLRIQDGGQVVNDIIAHIHAAPIHNDSALSVNLVISSWHRTSSKAGKINWPLCRHGVKINSALQTRARNVAEDGIDG